MVINFLSFSRPVDVEKNPKQNMAIRLVMLLAYIVWFLVTEAVAIICL